MTCAHDGSEADLVQALGELWRRRILREVEEEGYDVTHEKLREVCYESMSTTRRRLTQHRLNEARVRSAQGAP